MAKGAQRGRPPSARAKGAAKVVDDRKQKRKGFVAKYKAERGKGLKFSVETYRAVTSFTPGTRIKYGPNPKQKDSKSFARYAGYAGAKTVGEALKCGAKIADLCWELSRGHYTVLKAVRSEAQEVKAIGREAYDKAVQGLSSLVGPNGLSMSIDDPRATEELQREEAWRDARLKRVEKLARAMGLRVESIEEIEASTECADIRLERRVADALAAQKLKGRRKIRDEDVTEVLHLWGFCQNTGRVNVLPDGQRYVYSDTVGAIRRRTGEFGITPPTRRYPNFTKLLLRWLRDNRPKVACKFVCSAININANYAGRRHRDVNNEGPSVIRAFGEFTGGRLHYWPKDRQRPRPDVSTLPDEDCVTLDISQGSKVFDGNRAHAVEPFSGERYSLVYFTAKGWARIAGEGGAFLEGLGFPWPTNEDLARLRAATKTL